MKKQFQSPWWDSSGPIKSLWADADTKVELPTMIVPDKRHFWPTYPDLNAVTAPRLRNLPLEVDLSHVKQITTEMAFLLDKGAFMDLLEQDFHKNDYFHMEDFWSNSDPVYGVNFNWKARKNCTCFGCTVYNDMKRTVYDDGDQYDTEDLMVRVLAVTGVSIILGRDIIAEGKEHAK